MCMDNGLCMYTTDNLTSVCTIDLGKSVCTVCLVYRRMNLNGCTCSM